MDAVVLIILKKYPTHFRDECSVIDSNCAACTNKAECGFCYVEFTNNSTEGLGSCVAVREDDPEEPEYGRWVRRRGHSQMMSAMRGVSCRTAKDKFRIALCYKFRTCSFAHNLGPLKVSAAN